MAVFGSVFDSRHWTLDAGSAIFMWQRNGGQCVLKRKKTPPILLSEAKSREARDALLTGGPLMGDPLMFQFFVMKIRGSGKSQEL